LDKPNDVAPLFSFQKPQLTVELEAAQKALCADFHKVRLAGLQLAEI